MIDPFEEIPSSSQMSDYCLGDSNKKAKFPD